MIEINIIRLNYKDVIFTIQSRIMHVSAYFSMQREQFNRQFSKKYKKYTHFLCFAICI